MNNQSSKGNAGRTGLGVAPTGKGLHGGVSKRTGGHAFTTTRMKGTRGGTTSNTRTEDMKLDFLTLADGQEICVKPKPLVK